MKKIVTLLLFLAVFTFSSFSSPEYKMVKSQGEIVGRWLEVESIDEYNEKGDLIYEYSNSDFFTYFNGEKWYTYENDRLVYIREECTGFNEVSETLFDYDPMGNMIHEKTTTKSTLSKYSYRESEVWYEYDKNGNEIHSKSSSGIETWKTYNAEGILIQEKRLDDGVITDLTEYNAQGEEIYVYYAIDDNSYECFCEYDQDNHLIYSKSISNNKLSESYYEYDDKGLWKTRTSSDGSIVTNEYDSEGRIIKVSSNLYGEIFYEYDGGGNLIHESNALYEEFREYDVYNNKVYSCHKSSNGAINETWTEYEYWDDGIIKKQTVYRRI